MLRTNTSNSRKLVSYLKGCLLGILFIPTVHGQTTVKVNTSVQRFIGNVSEIERNKYFNLHSNSRDQDLNNFYNDYNAFPSRGFWGPFSYSKGQGNDVGTYPTPRDGNDNERNVTRFVGTEHPRSVFEDGLDAEKAAEWVAEYYSNFVNDESRPEFFEPMNEPFVHAHDFYEGNWDNSEEDRIKRQMSEVFSAVGQKIHETPALNKMKVIGYSAAWPSLELRGFTHWEENMKLFMDIAGDNMDAFATHLYDGVNVTGQNNLRSGSNSEAILDLIETYSYIKWGVVKPHAITEYGGITRGFDDHYTDLESIQTIRSINHMLFNLLDRENVIDISIPFVTDKSTWHLTEANDYQPYGAALFIPTNIGEPVVDGWRFSPKIHFFELWRNVEGKRIQISTDNPDVQVHGFVKENMLYLAFNNLDDETQSVNLEFIGEIGDVSTITTKSLKIYDDVDPDMDISTSTTLASNFDLIEGETVVMEVEFAEVLEQTQTQTETKYYTSTHLQPINANVGITFEFSDVMVGEGEASLLLGIGRKHDKSKHPVVKVNGTEINVPTNWKGLDQANRDDFFGVIDIPVDIELLNETNTVEVTFPDSDGHISSLILEVKNIEEGSQEDEAILILDPTSEVLQGTEVNVKLSYVAHTARDVVAEFWSPNSWLAEARATVQAGSGEQDLTITLRDIPELGEGYIIKSSIRPVGTNWTENIARHQLNDISVVDEIEEVTPYVATFSIKDENNDNITGAEITLMNESINFSQTLSSDEEGVATFEVEQGVTYSYTVSKDGYDDATGTITASETLTEEAVQLNMTEVITVVANAGTDQTVEAGDLVTLDGSASSPEGITYLWSTTSDITLDNNTTASPSFNAPDVEEETVITLELTVSLGDETDTDEVTITITPTEEEETSYTVAFSVTDTNDDKLSGAEIALSNESLNFEQTLSSDEEGMVSFEVEQGVTYNYTVSKDGYDDATGTITASETLTEEAVQLNMTEVITVVANAGTDQTVEAGDLVTLDGSASSPEGITYLWSTTSAITLENNTTASPSFTAPDVEEETVITLELMVNLGDETDTDEVTITITPTEEEETSYTVAFSVTDTNDDKVSGAEITLSNETLNFEQTLSSDEEGMISFEVEQGVTYNYTVSKDGYDDATGTITASETLTEEAVQLNMTEVITVVANAGTDQTVEAGDLVTLDGSTSSPEGITYLWSTTSAITLENNTTANPSFTAPDVEEETVITIALTVSLDTETDTDEVNIIVSPKPEIPTSLVTETNDIKIYPNPTKGIISLEIQKNAWVSLTDLLGNSISQKYYNAGVHSIDFSKYQTGMYIISVKEGTETKSFKVVKE